MLLEDPAIGALYFAHIPPRMAIGKFPQRDDSVADDFIQELLLECVLETLQNSLKVLRIIVG